VIQILVIKKRRDRPDEYEYELIWSIPRVKRTRTCREADAVLARCERELAAMD
jgi:hypothetical protein